MSLETFAIADAYWAGDMGCNRADLRPPETRVQSHSGSLLGYNGAFILVLDAAPLVSVPAEWVAVVSERASGFNCDSASDLNALRNLFRPAGVTRLIVPAHIHYTDEVRFTCPDLRNVRALSAADENAFENLRTACSSEAWDAKEFAVDDLRSFGAFDADGALGAIANYRIWDDRIAHISVIAHPLTTNRGYGTRAAAAATQHALAVGLVPQYRVPAQNAPSARIAQKLGFQRYGWSVAARFG